MVSTYLRRVFITGTYWYLTCTSELSEAAVKRLDRRKPDLIGHLEAIIQKRLISQPRVNPHAIASYRDTFRLPLVFDERRINLYHHNWPSAHYRPQGCEFRGKCYQGLTKATSNNQ